MITAMKNKLIILALLPLLLAASCGDDPEPDRLPAITQGGLNTFGCVIEGEVMIPKDYAGSIGGFPAKGLVVKYRNDWQHFFDIRSLNANKSYYYIYIYIPSLNATGTYQFSLSNGREVPSDAPLHPHAYVLKNNEDRLRGLYYTYENSGQINITRFDMLNTIISGTFEFKAFNVDNPGDTIKVTQGRFDTNWVDL